MLSILMGTFNGAKYLKEQIESIISQTYKDWILYIRDDGSTDLTMNILEEYERNYSNIKIVRDISYQNGAKYNFMHLLRLVQSDYYMFCDQDDIWLPDKIALSMELMHGLEGYNNSIPILIHTDMKIVDSNLIVLSESLYKTMRIKPHIVDSFNFMGVCSCGPGCTMLFNDKAKKVSLKYDSYDEIPMHDWWVAINTVKYGKVAFLPIPTILYRQHDNNTVGASDVNTYYVWEKIKGLQKTVSEHKKEFLWLKKVGYGGPVKFYFYKILYSIIRFL